MAVDKDTLNNCKIIGIDTSSRQLAIVCAHGPRIVFEINSTDQFKHIENLFVYLQKGCKKVGWKMSDVDVLICGVGPGSFTGLRVGLAAVKGCGAAGVMKIVAVSSLDIIAQNCSHETGDGAVIVNAYRGKVYGAFFTNRSNRLEKKGKDRLMSVDELTRSLRRRKKRLWLCGDALEPYGEVIRAACGSHVACMPRALWYPQGRQILCAAYTRIEQGMYITAEELAPRYLRLSGAEEAKK